MSDSLLSAAGAAPARGDSARWSQVALLGVAAASGGGPGAYSALAAALLAVDQPARAGVAAAAAGDDPWALWHGALAAGQQEWARLPGAIRAARAALRSDPDGREVARRLEDLEEECADLTAGGDRARFSVAADQAGPPRRIAVIGRSGAGIILAPDWERMRPVRLAPYRGPASGNGAHLSASEVLEAARRGARGVADHVAPDAPPSDLVADDLLGPLREDPSVRTAQLLALAEEVREERISLREQRDEIEDERARLIAERARVSRLAAAEGTAEVSLAPPTNRDAALRLLGLSGHPAPAAVENAWRDAVRGSHPDRVSGLHPGLVGHAEQLTTALNAARDLLLSGNGRRARRN